MKLAIGMLAPHLLPRRSMVATWPALNRPVTMNNMRNNCRQSTSVAKRHARILPCAEKARHLEVSKHTTTCTKACLSTSSTDLNKSNSSGLVADVDDAGEDDDAAIDALAEIPSDPSHKDYLQTSRDPKDRSRDIPWELSARYLRSRAYRETYKGMLVWQPYIRNFPRQIPTETRLSCIKFRKLVTNNPCPICRDEYLVVDYRNTELLNQFVSPHTGKIIDRVQTQVCRRKYLALITEIEKARDIGTIPHEDVHRHYDYSIYYGDKEQHQQNSDKKAT